MGNCFPLFKLTRAKYHENLETPSQKLETIPLASEDFISSLSIISDSTWAIGQENIISLYNDYTNSSFWKSEERVRCLDSSQTVLISGGKTLELFSLEGKALSKLSGHERPVNSIAIQGQKVLSGSADWSLRLWDIEKSSELTKNIISWNVITSIKWIDENCALQASEDLRLRVWDTRQSKLTDIATMNIGDNFATCCDVKGQVAITGHRGFSGNGCNVKIWDLRQNSNVLTATGHDMPVEGVNFLDRGFCSCGKDGKIIVYNTNGQVAETWTYPGAKPFVTMGKYKNGILTASIEPKIMFFSLNPLALQF